MTPISSAAAPAAIGPYSQAVAHGRLGWCSGQIALDPASGALVGETAPEQARRPSPNPGALSPAAYLPSGASNCTGGRASAIYSSTLFMVERSLNGVTLSGFKQTRHAPSSLRVSLLPRNPVNLTAPLSPKSLSLFTMRSA